MPQSLRVHLALSAVSTIYGLFYVAVKLLLHQVDQEELILIRFVLTALMVGAIEFFFFRTRIPSLKEFLKIAALGIVGVFLVQILIVAGLALTTSFHSALIMATMPIITLLFSILLRRESFHWQKIGGILLAFAGVAMLLASQNTLTSLPPHYLIGDLLMLLAAVCFSCFLLASQTLLQTYNYFSLMAYCYIISGVLFLLYYVGHQSAALNGQIFDFLGKMDGLGWGLTLYIVIFASIVTYTLNNYALRRSNPTIVAIYIFFQPMISAVLGHYLLQEPFTGSMALAAGITFAGVLLATLAPHKTFKADDMEEPY